jgi:hypothetical protein
MRIVLMSGTGRGWDFSNQEHGTLLSAAFDLGFDFDF